MASFRRMVLVSILGLVAIAATACSNRTAFPTLVETPTGQVSIPSATVIPTSTPSPTLSAAQAPDKLRVVGYFTDWGIASRGFKISDIAAEYLTTINYAFANITPDGTCALGDPVADSKKYYYAGESVDQKADEKDGLHGAFNQILKLKQAYPDLQVMISIGGWSWSPNFSPAAASQEARQKFVSSCVTLFFQKYAGVFDGVDIDWEYPVSGGLKAGSPDDRHNFTLLMSEFRTQLDAQGALDGRRYLLTMAAPAGPEIYEHNFEWDQVQGLLDWINLMTYDFHGSWDQVTGFQSALYASPYDQNPDTTMRERFNVNAAVQAYLAAGVPARKLVMGIPFYGRSWQGVGATNHGIFQPASGPGPGTWEAGVLDYSDIEDNYLPTFSRFWDADAQAPWLYDAASGVLVVYDDAKSLDAKAAYIQSQGLGGAMFWELSNDRGELLEHLAEALGK